MRNEIGFNVMIDCDGAGFGDDGLEVVRICRDVARRIAEGQMEGRIFDVNGDRCGEWGFTGEWISGAHDEEDTR